MASRPTGDASLTESRARPLVTDYLPMRPHMYLTFSGESLVAIVAHQHNHNCPSPRVSWTIKKLLSLRFVEPIIKKQLIRVRILTTLHKADKPIA